MPAPGFHSSNGATAAVPEEPLSLPVLLLKPMTASRPWNGATPIQWAVSGFRSSIVRQRLLACFVVEAVGFGGRLPAGSVGFVTFVLNGFFSRFCGRRACTAGRIRGERIDSVLRFLWALLRYDLERARVALVRGSRTHLVPGRSKAIEPSSLVYWGAGVRLVLHVDSPPVVPRVCSLMFLTNVWPYYAA